MTAERKAEQRCDGRNHYVVNGVPCCDPLPTESEPERWYRCDKCVHEWCGNATGLCPQCRVGIDIGNLIAAPAPETPSPEVGAEPEYECQVWQGDDLVANAFGSSLGEVEREAAHYAAQYRQDGPVEVKLFVRYLLAAAKETK
jgi:hypothetical protein